MIDSRADDNVVDRFDPDTLSDRGPVRAALRLALRRVRSVLGNDPIFLPIVLRATPRGTSRRITPATDLVVEGYPRSGNTFAAAALRHIGGDRLVIVSHVHTPSQVVLATRRSVPTLLVIRQPVHSVASLVIAAPHVPIDLALREWIDYYARLWQIRDKFVIATFEQVTNDFGSVIDRVNDRFGMDIEPFPHDEANVAAVRASMTADHERFHSGEARSAPWPTESRTAARSWLLAEAESPRHAELVASATDWYERYSAAAV